MPEFSDIFKKNAIEAAVTAMKRNRALLLTINLIGALMLVTIYVERFSFDEIQRENYLFAFLDIKGKVDALGVDIDDATALNAVLLSSLEERVIGKWEEWKSDPEKRKKASSQLYRLRRLYAEMNRLQLPSNQIIPIGLSVPHNDVVPIAGLFLVLLYGWFYCSHSNFNYILRKIKTSFLASESKVIDQTELDVFWQSLDLHFLFRTSELGMTKLFVKGLFFSPPVIMSLALINDLLSGTDWDSVFQNALRFSLTSRFLIDLTLAVILWFIAYAVNQSESDVDHTYMVEIRKQVEKPSKRRMRCNRE